MKKKTARFIIFSSFIVAGILVLQILFSEGGLRTYMSLKREKTALTKEIEDLTAQKRELEEEIWKLNSSYEYIESIARRDYDFLKKNEIILKFVEVGK
jgi:cell division protein FtsB